MSSSIHSPPQRNEAAEFLACFGRSLFDFSVTSVSEEVRQRAGFSMRGFQGSLEEHESTLQELNRAGCNVSVQLAAMNGETVASIPALYAILWGDSATKLARFELAPDMVISASPTTCYAFWFSGDIDVQEFPDVQDRLAALLGGDRTVTDLHRRVPLPGFVNYGDSRGPFLVFIEEAVR